MNIVTVSARHQKISPKKARLVMNLIRNKQVEDVAVTLKFLDKKAAQMIGELLKSAVDAASQKDFKKERLVISEAICSEGRRLKRHRPNARGRVNVFKKRMSHFKISLAEIESVDKTKKKIHKQEPAIKKQTEEKMLKVEKEQNGSKS